LPGGYVARRRGDELIIESEEPRAATEDSPEAVVLSCPGRTLLRDGRVVACSVGPFDAAAFARHCRDRPDGVELLDADRLSGQLLCRSRRDGDMLRPLGSAGRQSVGDFLTNLKLPDHRRRSVLCVCDDLGIVYLACLRIDDRVKVTGQTRRVMRIAIEPPGQPAPAAGEDLCRL